MFDQTKLSVVVFLLLLSSCTKTKESQIIKVEIAYDGCDMPFKGKVLEIDSSLNCYFYGDRNSGKPGFFKGRVGPELWDQLEQKLLSIDYKAPNESIADGSNYEAIIYLKNSKKIHIERFIGYKTTNDAKTLEWVLNSYKQINLTQTKQEIKFETTYQNPPPIPPIARSFLPPPK